MKNMKLFFACVYLQIKKKFFKYNENDFSHTCEKLKKSAKEVSSIEELKLTEDYATKYNTTTRWQTV